MFDCNDVTAVLAAPDADPRLDEDALRCLPAGDATGTVLLVGVVHDHPASRYRVAHLVERLAPDVLAVELPPLAVPLFELYADDVYTPPRMGGEMSTAIQSAGDARIVGIDMPNVGFLGRLGERVLGGGVPRDVLPAVLRQVAGSYGHALACRVAALVGRLTTIRLRVYQHLAYGRTVLDAPVDQASDERQHLAEQRAFLGAVETPPVMRLIDDAREANMAARLRSLRTAGDVVAVVGMEHLDPLEAALSGADTTA